jgi:acyl-coenzyme A thioesterase PaaI-like protein
MTVFKSKPATSRSELVLRGSAVGRAWLKLGKRAPGRVVFSAAYALKAPYFATVTPYVRKVAPGHAEVSAPSWFLTRNHIGSFHAIACCNTAEAAMGLVMEASTPPTHRWLPKNMTVNYVKIAKGGVRTTARLPEGFDFSSVTKGAEVPVSFQVVDSAGVEVANGTITTWVSPKPLGDAPNQLR